jgi:uncharacterized repeat protein (TIGR01451 family)
MKQDIAQESIMIIAMRTAAGVALALVITLADSAVFAQESDAAPQRGSLEVQTVVQKLREQVDENGARKTELVAVDTAVPGDEVVYTVTFVNIGAEPAENIRITNPIPPQMRYVSGTAFGPGTEVEYSVDGGSTWGQATALLVGTDSGVERPAEPDDYTHIRWALNAPLEVGERSFARFRAVVR